MSIGRFGQVWEDEFHDGGRPFLIVGSTRRPYLHRYVIHDVVFLLDNERREVAEAIDAPFELYEATMRRIV